MVADTSEPGDPASDRARPGRRGARPTPLPEGLTAVFTAYERSVAQPGGPLDADTVRVYVSRVRQYLAWLATAPTGSAAGLPGDPLTDLEARDRAVHDYRTHLQAVARRKPTTINAHLTAVDDFYRRRGLGPAAAPRAGIPAAVPRTLDRHDQVRLLRQADRAVPRDKAIAYTAFYAGTRISETTGLDVGDVHLSGDEGHLIVGGRGRLRQIPLHPKLRAALTEWLGERDNWKGAATSTALFLNRHGGRLSTRSASAVLRTIADAADLPLGRDGLFTPSVLRHTAGTTMARQGTDLVTVAELLGHSVQAARRYGRPGPQDRRQAIQRLTTDE